MGTIWDLFPGLSAVQQNQLLQLAEQYREWNARINVISRKDMDLLEIHHLLHSLLIGKLISFQAGAEVLDLGTGGGLPGIPLAILFPDTRFHLIDGTGKKIRVVSEISATLGLENVSAQHIRAEQSKSRYDFVVSRAVARLDQLILWSRPLIHQRHKHALPNGLICLKGGDLKSEFQALGKHEYYERYPLSDWTDHPYFLEKYLVYVQT